MPTGDRDDIGGTSWNRIKSWGWKQSFDKGDVYYYDKGRPGNQIVRTSVLEPVRSEYNRLNQRHGSLGYPVANRESKQSCGTNGNIQRFEKGEIHYRVQRVPIVFKIIIMVFIKIMVVLNHLGLQLLRVKIGKVIMIIR